MRYQYQYHATRLSFSVDENKGMAVKEFDKVAFRGHIVMVCERVCERGWVVVVLFVASGLERE